MKITEGKFGKHPNGQAISKFTIENDNGISLNIINYGGIITHLYTPDRDGKTADIVLGFDDLPGYLGKHPYFGTIVGRFCNRIAGGKFSIDGRKYTLAVNNGPNHLHGGIIGFDKKIWLAQKFTTNDEVGVKLAIESPDGDEGYPGNLLVEVEYALNNNNELIIRYSAQTDKPTHVNLTNHSYFNLSGCKNNILDHVLNIDADSYTETDQEQTTTGNILSVVGTALDFRTPKPIGRDLSKVPPGYDHNFVINRKKNEEIQFVARLEDPYSGRVMETFSTVPGVQLYTANYLDGSPGKNNTPYVKHMAICLETQHFPNSPNIPAFPSTLLQPGEKYSQTTVYKFATLK